MRRLALLFSFLVCTVMGVTPAHAVSCEDLIIVDDTATHEIVTDECAVKRDFDLAVRGARRNFKIYEASRFSIHGQPWYLDVTQDAIERSVEYYGRLLDVPSTTFVYGSGTPSDGRGRILGETITKLISGRCVVVLADGMFVGTANTPANRREIELTISHELFHCVQYQNWPRKSQGEIFQHAKWWMEGTAEYFSHTIYPAYATPANRAERFDAGIGRGGLMSIEHGNAVFFGYYGANHGGPEGIIRFIQRMSESLEPAGQPAATALVPGIADAFQDFAQKYFDRDLRDPGGHAFAVNPAASEAAAITAPGQRQLQVQPWAIKPQRYVFERGQDWRVTQVSAQGTAQFKARDDARTGAWSGPPVNVQACSSSPVLLVAATATDGDNARKQLELRFDRTPPSSGTACQCPLGVWHMDTEGLRRSGWRSLADGPLISGGMTLNFQPGGHASATFNAITHENRIDRYSSIRTVLNGSILWDWERKSWSAAQSGRPQPTGPGTDAFGLHRKQTSVTAYWEVQFVGRNGVVSTQRRPFRPERQDAGGANMAAAVCQDGNSLLLMPTNSAVLPASLPPYYGNFHR